MRKVLINMKNKNAICYRLCFILGLTTLMVGLYLLLSKNIAVQGQIIGIIFGLGSGIFGVGLSGILKSLIRNKNPKYFENLDVELGDERNVLIRTKAEAKAGKLLHWINIILCFSVTLMSAYMSIPSWIIIFIALSIVVYPLVASYYIIKINKEI